jgi:pimeloyl-ACP methyl ester carboxylesterase
VASIPWTTGTVSSDKEEIAFEVAGSLVGSGADTIVFCHGLGGNHAVWFQQVPLFAQMFRVVTWDQRGFGRSTNRAGASGPAAAVADLGRILDHLNVERAHLVGQSMGGWAVLGFALSAPARVSSLTIADSTAGVVTDTIMEVLTTTTRREVSTDVVGSHPAIGRELEAVKAFLYQQIGGFRGNVEDADMIGKLFGTRYDLEAVRALGVPSLCVVGADDDLIPPAAVREVATVLGARLVEIADAGHSPYFEHPDAWNTAVLEFVTALQ